MKPVTPGIVAMARAYRACGERWRVAHLAKRYEVSLIALYAALNDP